jgi:CubicO group peptidase (beta-lactamase class C family)
MTCDHLTPAQKAVSGFRPGYFYDIGWGFGMSVRTRRAHLGPWPVSYPPLASVGSYGWPGIYGTGWYNDPAEDMTTILMIQRARAARAADPLRLLDGRLPGHRRLTMRDPLLYKTGEPRCPC